MLYRVGVGRVLFLSKFPPVLSFRPVSQGPSAVEIAALPKWEARHATLGKSEGQVQVFQRAGKAIAAQWSVASSIWIEVGEVRESGWRKMPNVAPPPYPIIHILALAIWWIKKIVANFRDVY